MFFFSAFIQYEFCIQQRIGVSVKGRTNEYPARLKKDAITARWRPKG
jgi:hypothetical protein